MYSRFKIALKAAGMSAPRVGKILVVLKNMVNSDI